MIVCIGDSHSSVFSEEEKIVGVWPKKEYKVLSRFKPIRIGPSTAYNLFKKVNLLDDVLNKTLYFSKDYALFCFGEVDIRAHLIKQSKLQNKDVGLLTKECVVRYVEAIKLVKPKRKIQKAIFGPIASWSLDKPYDGPSYGTNLERNFVTKVFNQELEILCEENDIKFISIFESLLNKDGTTNSIYLDDMGAGIHLSQKAMPLIIKEMKLKSLL